MVSYQAQWRHFLTLQHRIQAVARSHGEPYPQYLAVLTWQFCDLLTAHVVQTVQVLHVMKGDQVNQPRNKYNCQQQKTQVDTGIR